MNQNRNLPKGEYLYALLSLAQLIENNNHGSVQHRAHASHPRHHTITTEAPFRFRSYRLIQDRV
jgi:hypothetical protein